MNFDFSFDDYRFRNEPYKMLYDSKGDKEKHNALLKGLDEDAKSKGYNDFLASYDTYSNMRVDKELEELNNDYTNFTSQPAKLICNGYKCEGNVIMKGDKVICFTPMLPVCALYDYEEKGNGVMYEVAYYFNGRWKTEIFSSHVLLENRHIVKLNEHRMDVSSQNANAVSAYFRTMLNLNSDIPEKGFVKHLGFTEKGFDRFVPFCNDLVFADERTDDVFKSIRECGDYETWLNEARKCRKFSLEARLTLAASFASVLIELLGGLPFFVHVWSPTSGSGKSVALMLAVSVWANPHIQFGGYVQTSNFTQAGAERLAGILRNLPFCIDETQASQTVNGKKFEVYKLTEGLSAAKADLTDQSKLAPKMSWLNCFITTGETQIVTDDKSGAGAYNRIFNIPCSYNHKVVENAPETADILKKNYGFAGKRFLDLLQNKEIFREVKECYKAHQTDLEKVGVSSKLTHSGAIIMAADYITSSYIFKDVSKDGVGLLTPQEVGSLLYKTSEISIGKRSYESIIDWIEIKSSFFDDYDNNITHTAFDKYGEFKLIKGIKYACIIKEKFDEFCSSNGFDSKAVLVSLESEGLIITNKAKGDYTLNLQVKRKTNERPRRVVIKLE